jgi:hypothetical protein
MTQKAQRIVTALEKLQLQGIHTNKKRVFIPDKTHKQNLPPCQHKVCAPIFNISHIVSTVLHCGLQRNDQYKTHNQRLVPHRQSNRQREEQLVRFPNLMECQKALDPSKPFSSVFLKDQEDHSTQAVRFIYSGLLDFLFLSCLKIFFVSLTRYFLCCSTTRI